jgi:hypothetical protein
MITIQEAFDKFKSRLELTEGEQADASRRQQQIREYLREQFKIDRDFLTGSLRSVDEDQALEGRRYLFRPRKEGAHVP